MHHLPETGFLRLVQIIGNPKAIPPIPAVIPVSKSTWWAGVKAGRYPRQFKLGPRITAWRVEDIRSLIQQTASQGASMTEKTNGHAGLHHTMSASKLKPGHFAASGASPPSAPAAEVEAWARDRITTSQKKGVTA